MFLAFRIIQYGELSIPNPIRTNGTPNRAGNVVSTIVYVGESIADRLREAVGCDVVVWVFRDVNFNEVAGVVKQATALRAEVR